MTSILDQEDRLNHIMLEIDPFHMYIPTVAVGGRTPPLDVLCYECTVHTTIHIGRYHRYLCSDYVCMYLLPNVLWPLFALFALLY